MPRPPDLHERVARMEETMATREELDALRARVESRQRPVPGWFWSTLAGVTIALGFVALLLMFTR